MGYQEPVGLQVLGVGDAFSFVHHNTCFLLSSPSGMVLIDGTPGLLRLLHQRGVPGEPIDSVILTHIHADHASGIESFLLYRRFRLGRKTRLFTSSRVMDSMKEGFFPSFRDGFSSDLKRIEQGSLGDYVDYHPLSETAPNRILPEVEVEIRHNWHPVPTLGLKLKAHETTVGISGDHCYRPGLLRELLEEGAISRSEFARMAGPWLWESDLIYHEVTRQSGGGHTFEQDLLSLSALVRSKLRLLHAPDGFIPGPLAMAAEGEEVVIFPGRKFVIRPSHP